MPKSSSRYLSFLLRLWQVGSAKEPAWRASLECAQTRERYGFADLDALFEFLKDETEGCTRLETSTPAPQSDTLP